MNTIEDNVTRSYKDMALVASPIMLFGTYFVLFTPVLAALATLKIFMKFNMEFGFLEFIFFVLAMLFMLSVGKFIRKLSIYKILVNPKGIVFKGALLNKFISWNDVLAIERVRWSPDILAKVMTSHGAYYFKSTMKAEDEAFPILKIDRLGQIKSWSYPDGTEKQANLDNCELFGLIETRIAKKPKANGTD